MKQAIENIRQLTKVETDTTPQTSIDVWLEELSKGYGYLVSELSSAHKRVDDLTFDLSAAHRDIKRLERELSQAIDIIEESGVDYDEIVKAIDS